MFYRVYVDKLNTDKTAYEGSMTATEGDRVRIYPTSWEYEPEMVFYNNEELKTYIDEYINSEIECYAIAQQRSDYDVSPYEFKQNFTLKIQQLEEL